MATKGDKALQDAGKGAAIGSLAGPWGTLIGGVGGAAYGYLSGDDPAPPPPPHFDAPQIDSNTGIGSGYGGMTPQEQAAALAEYREKNPGAMQYLEQTKAAAARARAEGNTAAADQLDAAVQKQMGVVTEAANKLYQPDMSDPSRFKAWAEQSQTRGAPVVGHASFNNDAINSALTDQAGSRTDVAGQIQTLQNDRSGAGQQDLVNTLKGDMSGQQPSLAQLQLDAGVEASARQQAAAAASAGPMSYGIVARQAALNGADTDRAAIRDASMLRAQEYATARGQLGEVLNQQRTGTLQNNDQTNRLLVEKRAQDLTRLGMSYQDAINRAQLEYQENAKQADVTNQTNSQNDAMTQNYLNHYLDLAHMQQGNAFANQNAAVATNATNSGSQQAAATLAQNQGQFDTNRTDKYVSAGIGAAGAAAHLSGQGDGSDPSKKDGYTDFGI